MTTTRKKTTKIDKEIKETVETKEVTTKKTNRRSIKQLDQNEMVLVRSVYQGTLCYKSIRTGLKVLWEGYGAEEWMTIQELLTLKASKPVFLTKPWIIIDDLEVVEYMGLTDIYDAMVQVEDIEGMFSLSLGEIKEKVNIAPKGFKSTIAETAKKMIAEERLFDIRVIKMLEEELNMELR